MIAGLEREVVSRETLDRAIGRFRDAGIRLPRLSELAEPSTLPETVTDALAEVDPDAPHPMNLYRVHWYNADDRRARETGKFRHRPPQRHHLNGERFHCPSCFPTRHSVIRGRALGH